MKRLHYLPSLIALLLLLSVCRGLGQTPPPPPLSVDELATAIVLTENAPPPGYATVTFPTVDAGLDDLPGYRYVFEMRFEGVFSQTSRETRGHVRAEVWWDNVGRARRVVLSAEGDAFVQEPRHAEAVRLGDAYYLVDESGACLTNVEATARAISSLAAGDLIGGADAVPYAQVQAVLNGMQAYRYDLTPAHATLPAIYLTEDSTLDLVGELWVAPEQNSVVRYYANVDVENVRLFESQLPVDGQVFIRYDAYDIGIVQNISIPFGC